MGFVRPLVILLLALGCAACGSEPAEETAEPTVRPVKFLVVEEAGTAKSRRYPAVVQAATSTQLTFQVSGKLQELAVVEAQEVKKGAVLARLDSRDLRSSLDAAKAQFDNAESEYQRAQRLAAGDAIAQSQLEQRKSARDTARAQLDAAEKAVSDAVLVAPFSGMVATVHVEKFQNLQPLEPVITLIGLEGLEVTVNVPAAVVARSNDADGMTSFVLLDAAPALKIPATFKEIDLEADRASQTYEVALTFQPPEDLIILPGMNATVLVEDQGPVAGEETAPAGVAVPLSAIQNEAERNYVWVIDTEAMTASKRGVTTQAGVGETLIVIEGLTAGETIAGAGAAYLAEGMPVRPWTD